MSGLTIRNFADAEAAGDVYYNAGVPYDAAGALLVAKSHATFRGRLALMGDSITRRHINDVSPYIGLANEGFWNHANELAGGPIRRILNHGVSGETSTDMYARRSFVRSSDKVTSLSISSITTSSTTATITTTSNHGIPVGVRSILGSIAGTTNYNLTNVRLASATANTLTMQIASGTANETALTGATLTYTNFGADVVAVGPASINDITALSTSADLATVQAAIASSLAYNTGMWDYFLSIGILPIAVTIQACTYADGVSVALSGSQLSYLLGLNQAIRLNAQKYGIPLFDLFAATVDGASASLAFKTNYSASDGKHLSNLGGFYGGLIAAPLVRSIFGGGNPDLPSSYLDSQVALTPTGSGNGLMQNPTFTGTGGSVLGTNVSGTVADQWRVRLETGTATSVVASLIPYVIGPDEWFTSLQGSTPGTWTTALYYERNECVLNSSTMYRCVSAHVAGTFATDLAAGLWEIVPTRGFWQQIVTVGASNNGVVTLYFANSSYTKPPADNKWTWSEAEVQVHAASTMRTLNLFSDIVYSSAVQGYTGWQTTAGLTSGGNTDNPIVMGYRKLIRTEPVFVDPLGGGVGSTGWDIQLKQTFNATGASVIRVARMQGWQSADKP